MFKKKGLGGFKPRAPIARPRPQATASPASPAPTPAAEGLILTPPAPASADGGRSPPDAPAVEDASPQPQVPVPGPDHDADGEREIPEMQPESTAHGAPSPFNEAATKPGPVPKVPVEGAQRSGAPALTPQSSVPQPSEPPTTVQSPPVGQFSSSASVGATEALTTASTPTPQPPASQPLTPAPAQPARSATTQATACSSGPTISAAPAGQTPPPTQPHAASLGRPSSASPIQTSDAPQHSTPTPPSAPSSRRRKRLVASTESGEPSRTATQPRKRQKRAPAVVQDAETAQSQEQPRPRVRTASTTSEGAIDEAGQEDSGAVATRRRQRSATPEDAEVRLVDLQTLKMSDLTRDLHIGKKFSRHDELKKREKELKTRAKKRQEGTAAPPENSPAGSEVRAAPARGTSVPKPPSSTNTGLQYQIIDGQIVIDQRSLALDRHARAEANREGDLEEIEENDFTRLITSSAFRTGSKLRGPNYWSIGDTSLFYRGLRMFGTDFETISKMFPGRTRRHVKMKFNREERKAGAQVTAALTGEKAVKMDIDEYKTWTGLSFENVEDIMADQDKRQAEYDAEAQRVIMEKEEEMRKKREELFADNKEEDTGKKKKRQKKTRQGLGEEVSVEVI